MKLFQNLRFRLLFLVFLAVIPALGVTVYSGMRLLAAARDAAIDQAFSAIRVVSNGQLALIDTTQQMLNALAASPAIESEAACTSYLRSVYQNRPMRGWVVVTDAQGEVYCSTGSDVPRVAYQERNFFKRTLASKQPTVGRPFEAEGVSVPLLPLGTPVLDSGQNVRRVVIALIDMTLIISPAVSDELPPQSALLLVDPQGTIITRYPDAATYSGLNLPDAPIIRNIVASRAEGSSESVGVDGVRRLYAFTPLALSEDYVAYIAAGIPSRAAFAGAIGIFRENVLLISLAGLVAFLAAWYGGDVFFLRVVSLTAERDAAEQQLRVANAELEERVAARTAELASVNEQLQHELAERRRSVIILRQREIEMNRLLKRLERSNRDLQDFAYITSHDLQEPLRKIQAFGDRLSRRYHDQVGDEGQMFIERMNTSASRMQRMINDLLDYSRVSTHARAFEPVNLAAVAAEVVSDLEVRIEENQARVEVGPLPVIEADPAQMRQLFLNLIGNAIKFRRAEVEPVVRISAGEQPDEEGRILIRVEDNGIGFDEKFIDRIFLPFQRLHSKDAYEGSGIGLAVCRKIVERHGGEITAASQIGQGSVFQIRLPLEQPKREEEPA